ncbi:TrbC/VirB2 family protein [Lysobacter enzymogenes]|uniref:TrbC/VirB2 family protein n=1 Tax=Lysobacter enzymogenes TaxID=69 RepID=UPI001A975BE1|nr:TrbC/VirB2 family protein [Lysobacter enzymogenes]QQP97415.1 TrbC/VirB2 family protein [Lysobacter enzymogenes]
MNSNIYLKNFVSAFLMATAFVVLLMLPEISFAQTDAAGAKKSVSDFMNNLNALLNIISIAVVTIAVIFAGYGIAFAHKRLSDVLPILLGAFFIGGAAQLAKMIVPKTVGSDTSAMVTAILQNYA